MLADHPRNLIVVCPGLLSLLPAASGARRIFTRQGTAAIYLLHPRQGVDVRQELLKIPRREFAHQRERAMHEATRVKRTGISRHLLQRLKQLSLGTEPGPDFSEVIEHLQFRPGAGPRQGTARCEAIAILRRMASYVIE